MSSPCSLDKGKKQTHDFDVKASE